MPLKCANWSHHYHSAFALKCINYAHLQGQQKQETGRPVSVERCT